MSDASSAENSPSQARERLRALLDAAGVPVRFVFGVVGEHAIMLGQAMAWLFRRPFRTRLFFEQMEFVGVGSLPIIMLVGFFSGAVSAQHQPKRRPPQKAGGTNRLRALAGRNRSGE